LDDLSPSLLERAWVHVGFAFAAMGGWALYANWGYAMPKPVIAALIQGVLSGTITFGMKRVLDRLRAAVSRPRGVWVPPLITLALSLTVLVLVNMVCGTPEVIKTIAVPFSVASTYAVIYNFAMWTKGLTP
jgi:mannose/fructose/N-acetylgalactosamine-specific phosphotransferase system component IIC